MVRVMAVVVDASQTAVRAATSTAERFAIDHPVRASRVVAEKKRPRISAAFFLAMCKSEQHRRMR
jgi:hypothetical protein